VESQTITGYWLSPQQQRVCSLQQTQAWGQYCVQAGIAITGEVNELQLQAAMQRVIERHEILRTVFRRSPGVKMPFQVILESGGASWQTADLSTSNHHDLEASRIPELSARERVSAFDLENGPVVRCRLVRTGTHSHLLILTIPALCADSRTLTNLMSDLAQCLASIRSGEPLPGEPLRYVQFSDWQNELLQSDDEHTQEGIEYWRKNAAAAIDAALPGEMKTSDLAFDPGGLQIAVSAELADGIRAIAATYSCSVQTVLLACWEILLSRLTGQTVMTAQVRFEGREYEELRQAAGPIAKYLPLSLIHI